MTNGTNVVRQGWLLTERVKTWADVRARRCRQGPLVLVEHPLQFFGVFCLGEGDGQKDAGFLWV
jgi:hypothetical protein